MATVRIPTPLRKLTKGEAEVAAKGNNVKEILENLEQNFSGLKERICDEHGSIRRFVNVYLNDEDIRFLNNLETKVKEGDSISIVPAIAGGIQYKKKVYLTFEKGKIKEPVIWEMGNKFKVITNVRQASISDEIGIVALELDGTPEEMEKAIAHARSRGIKVEPIDQNVIEG